MFWLTCWERFTMIGCSPIPDDCQSVSKIYHNLWCYQALTLCPTSSTSRLVSWRLPPALLGKKYFVPLWLPSSSRIPCCKVFTKIDNLSCQRKNRSNSSLSLQIGFNSLLPFYGQNQTFDQGMVKSKNLTRVPSFTDMPVFKPFMLEAVLLSSSMASKRYIPP